MSEPIIRVEGLTAAFGDRGIEYSLNGLARGSLRVVQAKYLEQRQIAVAALVDDLIAGLQRARLQHARVGAGPLGLFKPFYKFRVAHTRCQSCTGKPRSCYF